MFSTNTAAYVPKLYPEMPDWEKVKYYEFHFPPLGKSNKPVSDFQAIGFVNELLLQEKLAYEERVRIREEKKKTKEDNKREEEAKKREEEAKKKQAEEDKKRIKEEAHVAAMRKKYGYGWENDVDGTDEDCPTAYELRLEWEREDEYQRISAAEAYEQQMDKEEHENALFNVRMELETRGMTQSVKQAYIQEKRVDIIAKRWEREVEIEAAFYEEGQQICRAMQIV
jgi:hypothetical protein